MSPEAEELNLEEERGLANCFTELLEGLRLPFVWVVGAHHKNTQQGDFVRRVESVTEMHRATFLFIFSYLEKLPIWRHANCNSVSMHFVEIARNQTTSSLKNQGLN